MSLLSTEISRLYNLGISLIPVHETNKNPLVKEFRNQPRIEPLVLIDLMNQKGWIAIAIVLGKVSGRVVCIDIDTKYKAGFDATLFTDIKSFYPDLWPKLKIEKTPSGGYHLFYKIGGDGDLPLNAKLASRQSTEKELQEKAAEKTKCFLEIKSEGGLSQCYPSPGYLEIQGKEFHEITLEEHLSLITLCSSYNEVVEIERVKPTKGFGDSEFYSTNPFEDFDNSGEAHKVLEEAGWEYFRQNERAIYYLKPGKKDKDISASYSPAKRLYTIFTTTTNLPRKSLSPSNLLAYVKFDGDKKELYSYLVAKGFGKIKEKIEQRIVKKAAQYGNELPANISSDGRKAYEQHLETVSGVYPFGIFWEETPTEGYSINREKFLAVTEKLGYRLYGNYPCKIDDYIIERIDERGFFDKVKKYIGKDFEDNYEDICDAYEAFLQKAGKFMIGRLPLLDTGLLLKGNKNESFKAYKNGIVHISSDNIELVDYETIEKGKIIWKHQIQERDFVFGSFTQGLYHDFLDKCCGISDHLMRCIGYYSHDYKSTNTAYVVVLCEMTEDPKNGGGAGKNIFTNLLNFTTSLLNKPAKGIKLDDTMLRTWKHEKVLSLNDLDRNFPFLDLREFVSGQWELGKKFLQEETISNEDLPKVIANTNFSFDPSLPGLKRRLVPLEFSDFFIKTGGVDVYYKRDFPSDKTSSHDWTDEDWIGFDNFIVMSVQAYIKNRCKLTIPNLTESGWVKQFEQRFGALTHQFIKENIADWCRTINVKLKDFNDKYTAFCVENNVNKQFMLTSIRQNEALSVYCEKHDIKFTKNKNVKENNIQNNCKVFEIGIDLPEIKVQVPEKWIDENEEEDLDLEESTFSLEDLPF